ncbi:MAG: response regulator [Pseudobacteriovorax sp.]|nr:response regulator [Pseudobacteriovorax sp.]
MAKILVVDDSEILRKELRALLVKNNHEVIEAVDGIDGIDKSLNHPDIALIILDFNMPRVDGITMLCKLNDDPNYEKKPVFMLTTERNDELKAIGKKVGVLAWILKPFHPTKLLNIVEKILQKYPKAG